MKNANKKSLKQILKQEFYNSWWVGLVLIFIGMLYIKTDRLKEEKILDLTSCLSQIESEKLVAGLEKERLVDQIKSLEDPDYVEMLLIKKMGVVPEDMIKARFDHHKTNDSCY